MAGENTLVSMPRCPQDESSAQHELWIRLDAAIRKFTALNAGEYGDMNRADKKVEARLREINTGLQGKVSHMCPDHGSTCICPCEPLASKLGACSECNLKRYTLYIRRVTLALHDQTRWHAITYNAC